METISRRVCWLFCLQQYYSSSSARAQCRCQCQARGFRQLDTKALWSQESHGIYIMRRFRECYWDNNSHVCGNLSCKHPGWRPRLSKSINRQECELQCITLVQLNMRGSRVIQLLRIMYKWIHQDARWRSRFWMSGSGWR
jgi:hypothetical protein